MAFVRTKTVKGIEYHYLVEGIREDGKVRQRVVCYLGQHASVRAAYRFWSREARKSDKSRTRFALKMLKALKRYL